MANEKKIIKNFFDDVPLTKKHKEIVILIGIAMLCELADNYNFSLVAPTLREYWGVSVQQIGFIGSLFGIGMLLGTIFWGIISDKFGRRKAIIISAVFFSIASIIDGFAPNITIFAIFRFLTAFGIAGVSIVSFSYMMEMLPCKDRGRICGLTMSIGMLGMPLVAILCNVILPHGGDAWRYIYYLGGIGLLIAAFGARLFKESPRWLVQQGRVKEAEKVVSEIVGDNYVVDLSEKVCISGETGNSVLFKEILSELFKKKNLKNTSVLIIATLSSLCGGLVFMTFAPTILTDTGFSMEQSLFLGTVVSFGLILGPIITTVISEWGGRKLPITWTIIFLGIGLVLFGLTKNIIVLCGIGAFVGAMHEASIVMVNSYAPETLGGRTRNSAASVVSACGRLVSTIAVSTFPVLYGSLGAMKAWWVLGAICVVGGLYVGVFGKRTSGVCLEDLEE